MKDTYTQEEILDILESALVDIETELVINGLFHNPLSQEQLNTEIINGRTHEAITKTVKDAIQNGQTAGKLMMLDYIKEKFKA